VVFAEDLVLEAVKGVRIDDADAMRRLARTPIYVPTMMPVYELLATFRSARLHSAVVLDEYGGVAGLVALDDLLSALVGDVPSAPGDIAPFVKRPDASWDIDGTTPLDEIEARLDLEVPERERAEILTLGGWVMNRLGRLPREGDEFQWDGRRVSVLRMKGRRVDRVLIGPLPKVNQ